jgi:tRNA dimethylallyltransferase
MSIGTAKPSPRELAAVPHHLVDVAKPSDGFSLAAFLAQARAAIGDVLARRGVPVVVGGTGQYVWGLAEGWQAPSVPPQTALRARLEREAAARGPAALHRRLAKLDPGAAAVIDGRNVRRTIRALEVLAVTGKPFSSQRLKEPPPFEPRMLAVAVERAELHRRIDARADAMLETGWLDEVRSLLAAGLGPELPAFSSAGYRELAAHLRGEITISEAAALIKTSTHRLARRQATWFKPTDPRIAWCADPQALAVAARGLLTSAEPS